MPAVAFMPSRTMTIAPVGTSCESSILPSASRISMRGCRFDSDVGRTTSVFAPVARSVSVLTEMSSSKSWKTMSPAASERTGTECGSHTATFWPFLTAAPSSMRSVVPIWSW